MTRVEPIPNESVKAGKEELREKLLTQTPIDRILQKLSCRELPAQELFERYMRHKWCLKRYCRVANLKVQRHYYKPMQIVLQRTQVQEEDEHEGRSWIPNGFVE